MFLNGISPWIKLIYPSLPFFPWLSEISALIFVLAGLALYFLFIKPKIKRLETENKLLKEEASLLSEKYKNTTIETLKGEIENLKEELTQSTALPDFQAEYKVSLIKEREDQIRFLSERAAKEEDNITAFVRVERVVYSDHDFEGHPHAKIIFA